MKNLFQWPRSGKNARRSSSLAAVLAAAAALCLIPGVARAAGNSQALQFGVGGINGYNSASDTYSYIYYGNYEEKNLVPRAPVKWRVLSVTGNDGVYSDGTNAEINPLFILSETSLGLMSDMSNIWEFRSSRAWCRAFAGIEPASYCEPAFTRSELNAVLETTKSDADPAVDHILNGEKVFLLSKEEAEEPAYGFINDSNRQSLPFDPAFHSWGLRSPYPADQNRMYCVGFSGDIRIADGTNPFEYSFLMCPACNLNPSAIIFSSPAVGGKTGINALAAVPSTDTREWKLTLADSSRQAFSAVTTALEGNRLTIAYSGTPAYNSASWHNEFISAIIKDKNDKIKYYGRIGRPSEESVSGTVHIDLSSVDVQDGDKLYVFSEQCNGDQQTDYASPLIEVSMNTSARAVRLGAAGIYGYTRASDHSLSYHHIYCGDINGAPVKWRVLDDKANTGAAGLFLLSEDCLEATSDGNLAFNTNGNAQWQGSTAQAWCKDLAGVSGAGTDIPDAFSPIELAALLPTTKTDGAYSDSYMPSYSFAAGDILQGDKLFFLSAEEAGARVYGFENLSNRIAKSGGSSKAWWLRSSMDEARKAGYIRETGYMDADHSSARNFARPAFNLDRSAVLFASAASNSAHNDFAAPAAYSGKEWKLTLKDGNSFAQDASKTSGETELAYGYSDQTLSFSHAALSSFSADYTNVTAALSDENGDVLYYGSINSDGNATSSSLTIPSGLQAGSYTLSIYGEDWNEPNRSDYATGTPFTMTVRVCLPKSTAPATDAPAVAKNRARQQAVSFTLTNAAALRGAH